MKKMTRLVTRSFVASLLFASVMQGQVWVKKEYTKWSKSDCQKILNDSPWASSYTIGTVLFQPVNEPSAVEGRDTQPQMTYTAQFWSAKPIRQAIIRMQQLDAKYDKMTPEQKKVFDEKALQFLNMDMPDQIVIQVSYAGSQAFMIPVVRFWRQKTQGELRQNFNLIGRQGRIAPVQVIVSTGGGNEIQLIFPRLFNGEPVVTADLKELRVEIGDPNEVVKIPFQVKKMKIGEELVF